MLLTNILIWSTVEVFVIKKSILNGAILGLLFGLSGCGGGSSDSNTPSLPTPDPTPNTPAQFSGDLALSVSADSTDVSGVIAVTDPDTNEASAVAQNQVSVNYTFSAFVKGDGQLSVMVDGQRYSASNDSSSYRFTSLSFNSGAAVVDGIFADSTVLAEKISVYANLAEDEDAEDSFRPDTLVFNSGNNNTVTIFAQYQSTAGDDIRIDQFSVTSSGAPTTDTSAFFDEFRLVSHPELP